MRTFLIVVIVAAMLAISQAKEKQVKKRGYPFFSNNKDPQNSQSAIFASVEDNADSVEAAWNDAQSQCANKHGRTQIICISQVVQNDIKGKINNPYAIEYVQGAVEGLMAPCDYGNAEAKKKRSLKGMPKDMDVVRNWVKEGFKKAKRQDSSDSETSSISETEAEGFQSGLVTYKKKCASQLTAVYSSSASASANNGDQTTVAASYELAKNDPGHRYLNCVWMTTSHALFPMKSFQLLSNYVSGFLSAYNSQCYPGSSWETVIGPSP